MKLKDKKIDGNKDLMSDGEKNAFIEGVNQELVSKGQAIDLGKIKVFISRDLF